MIGAVLDRLARVLRQRRRLALGVPLALVLAGGGGALLAVRHLTLLSNVDHFVADWETAALLPAEPQDPNIVVVAITEGTLRRFPYRSPVDRQFLSELLTTLASRGPRAIGLDVLFDQPSEPAKDALLRRTLRQIPVPLVVSYTDDPAIVTPAQLRYLDAFVPPRLRGFANLAEDQLDTVRWIFPGRKGSDGHFIRGFAPALAAAVGVTPPAGLVTIAWHGRPGPGVAAFREYPAQDVAALPAAWFKGKIVLIGADLSLTDRHRTPFLTVYPGNEGMLPGIVIHAHALAQLIEGRRPPTVPQWDVLIVFLCAAIGAALGAASMPLMLRLGVAVVLTLLFWVAGAALFHYAGIMIGLVAPSLALALALWGMDTLTGREARRQREFIKGAFGRYVSPKVVERLIHDPAQMSLEGERRVMTFLFTDVADFTTMSERLDSRELARILNAYLDGVTRIVLKYDGMVDKFIGDAVFVIFNAPVDQADHAERAVRCALEIDRFAESFHVEQNAKGVPFGLTRIGINTGSAVIGNFGSRSRFSYTATGDAVNTAARLEGINKTLGTRICVSQSTRALCNGVAFRPVAAVMVKGKSEAVEVWEPLHEDKLQAPFLARYCEAFSRLETLSPDALDLFAALHAEDPADPCVRMHLARLRHGARGIVIS